MCTSSSTVASVVRRYYDTVADLRSTEEDLLRLLDEKVRVIERPNLTAPRGATRDLADTVRGFRAGKALLSQQAIDVHEVLVDHDRAAVRATWRGVVGVDTGPYHAGQALVAHTAALFTVRNGLVVEQETFDCFETNPPQPL